jgi:hypothetical protein
MHIFSVQISTPNFFESCRAIDLGFCSKHLSLVDDDLVQRYLKINSLHIYDIKFFDMTDFSHGTLVMGRAMNSTIFHMLVLYFSHHGSNLMLFYHFFHHISRGS